MVCSIGSTDPTAGAGLFLDAAVYSRLRAVRGVYVVAGITAQNSRRVGGVLKAPSAAIVSQLDVILEQVRPDAIRVGLIPGRQACIAVADRLRRLKNRPPIVIDPVMVASTGGRLQSTRALEGLRKLLRVADIATPNAAEAAALASMRVVDVADAQRAGTFLAKRYGCAVLVTGGHLRTGARIVDVLAHRDGSVERFAAARLRADARGTGCMLAASLSVALARGADLPDAVRFARRFVRAALVSARPLGRGRRQFVAAGVGRAAV
ncbi:MAG TPA: hydroxymethylpyrimidine/phosphomethylpyrimidine kinase [Candidatus Eremiobacteraceae bacterium]|nr:hydroxymethylpyrimidine/phosphomethylpyrimidine kinase [Candidatus Eremiobacteraceae bacterium]